MDQKAEQIGNDAREKLKELRSLTLADVHKSYKGFLKRLPDISHLKNIVLFGGIATLLIFILFSQRFAALYEYLPKEPMAGGTYREGVIGKIESLNPIYSTINSAENAVSSLVFSGLTKKDGNRQAIPDLAEKWEVSQDEKEYTFYLKKNLKWHDGQNLTADDVVFTINTIQNPDTRSPLLEVWKGVETAKKDDQTVFFKLQSPYAAFLSVTDLPIIPKHLLEQIPARNLKIAEFNNEPIGSGPFAFESFKKIKESQEITLTANKEYYAKKPYLSKVVIKSYPNFQELTQGYTKREVMGIERLATSELGNKSKLPNMATYQLGIPKYDVLIFNMRKGATKDKGVREAISQGINNAKIIEKVYQKEALPISSPILTGYLGYNSKLKQTFDATAAKAKLAGLGFVAGPDGILTKDNAKLTLRLLSSDDPEKSKESDLVAKDLKEIGIEVKQEKYPMNALLQDHVRPRDFDLLLISQNLGGDPDLYAFWHASQANDPGLNFSGFSDRTFDKHIEYARMINDKAQRSERYKAAGEVLFSQVPAVFLAWPSHLYGVSKEVKGISNMRLVDQNNRFWNITEWYIKEKRAK